MIDRPLVNIWFCKQSREAILACFSSTDNWFVIVLPEEDRQGSDTLKHLEILFDKEAHISPQKPPAWMIANSLLVTTHLKCDFTASLV